MPYKVRDVEQIVSEFAADDQPYAVFIDNNLRSKPDYLVKLCRGLRSLKKIWSAALMALKAGACGGGGLWPSRVRIAGCWIQNQA
jgi:hypothetical protein